MEVSARTRALVGMCAAGLGLLGGWALAALLQVEVDPKRLSGLEWSESQASLPPTLDDARGAGPLPLRLVDMGGVGIPADTAAWGTSYSHATHAFAPLILDHEPWVDPVKAEHIRRDWIRYLDRMAALGSNGVILDLFLELVNFDEVGSGAQVYSGDHPLRPRHRAYRTFVRSLTSDAAERGVSVYLETDLPAVTPPLRRYLEGLPEGDNPATEAFWTPYAAAFQEIFDSVPGIAGAVLRIGEAGPLYNVEGVEYSSYMGVREPEELRQMLRTLLPVFEEGERTLIFRSWSVGLGPLGDLHNDPEVYRAVLGPIRSPTLIVSTKFVQGDYFGFLPLNPTLGVGEHRRIVEFQARREYEGFGALPNYLGRAHASALRQILAANPHVVGTSIWTQEGGPLRAGPLSLYDVTGFWRWTDANVYATARLSLDPGSDPRALAEEWARATFVDDPEVGRALGELLITSREAMEKGLYIRPYAEQRLSIVGIDTPPLLWIFEWDVVGGWSSVLASLYHSVADDIETPIREGWEAVELTREMQRELDALAPRIGRHPDYAAMRASLDYQLSLFTALADFRESFLRRYAWLSDGGDPAAWQEAARGFVTSGSAHRAAYGDDLDFPAFDLVPALATTRTALNEGRRTLAARGLAALLVVGLLLGTGGMQALVGSRPGTGSARWLWLAGVGPDRLAALEPPGGPALALALTTLWAGLLAGVGWVLPTGAALTPGLAAVGGSFVVALALGWTGTDGTGRTIRWATAAAIPGPLLWVALAVLVVTAARGPAYLWYLFWTHDAFRALLFAGTLGLTVWTLVSSFWSGLRVSRGNRRLAGGSVVMGVGAVLLVLGVVLPDLDGILAALDEPLRLLPMRRAIINGITHYAGVEAAPPFWMAILGAVGISVGLVLRGRRSGAEGLSPTVATAGARVKTEASGRGPRSPRRRRHPRPPWRRTAVPREGRSWEGRPGPPEERPRPGSPP